MPLYEYRCNNCRRKTTVFVRGFSSSVAPKCSYCGSEDMARLISKVAILKSEESRLESLAAPSNFGDVDENDPRSVARWAKKMGREMGEDLGPDFDEVIDRMEAGETPDDMGDMPAGPADGLD